MSKVQEDLTEIYEKQKTESGSLLQRAMTRDANYLKSHPGADCFSTWSMGNIMLLMKMGRARFDGGDPWPDAQTAMEVTSTWLNNKFYEFLVQAMAFGSHVGFSQNNPEMKDYDFNQLQSDDEQWKYVLVYRDQFLGDTEVLNFIGERFGECASSFAQLGFTEMTGKETCHVWDLWRESLKSCAFVLYRLGLEAGRRWWDEEVLAEIEKAMQ